MKDAAYNLGRSSLLVASILTGKYENIRAAVGDRLHQRYRKKLIPNIDDLFDKAYKCGALGVYLSGAGPTVIAIVKAANKAFERNMNNFLKSNLKDWHLHMLKADNSGAVVCYEDMEG